jgi:hypothetical protein
VAKKTSARRAKEIYQAVDHVCKAATGKDLKDTLKMGVSALIETIDSKITEGSTPPITSGPLSIQLQGAYRILHCLPTDDDIKVRSWFRLLVKETHPEIGERPDEVEFERVTNSYNLVMNCRHPPAKEEPECHES